MSEVRKLNDGHVHEAIDRIDVSINYLQAALAEHALISAVENFDYDVQAAIEILADLYQKIGSFESVSEISHKYGLKKEYVVANT